MNSQNIGKLKFLTKQRFNIRRLFDAKMNDFQEKTDKKMNFDDISQ